jgi:hypothetical protein
MTVYLINISTLLKYIKLLLCKKSSHFATKIIKPSNYAKINTVPAIHFYVKFKIVHVPIFINYVLKYHGKYYRIKFSLKLKDPLLKYKLY